MNHIHYQNGPNDLCATFLRAAHWIWERRKTAKAQLFPFSEETITESVLLDLATECSHLIKVVPFNKREEGRIGADWEWCFYNKRESRFLPMLVQAKVLDNTDNEYSHIDRKIGNTGVEQIGRLLETARKRSVPAIYAFYNHLDNPARIPVRAGALNCNECWGASIALGTAVRSLLPDKSFDTMKNISRPWSSLVCSPQEQEDEENDDAPGRAAKTLAAIYNQSLDYLQKRHSVFDTKISIEVKSNPPEYLRDIDELTRADTQDARSRIIEELTSANPNIDGIVTIMNTID